MNPHLLVLAGSPVAGSPVAGRVKTCLCPPYTPQKAGAVAEAALADTLDALAASAADRRIVALDGDPGPSLPPGFKVIPRVEGAFEPRLAAAWATAGGQIGMDTPQVTAGLLDDALEALDSTSAALGLAEDGGMAGHRSAPSGRPGVPGRPHVHDPDRGGPVGPAASARARRHIHSHAGRPGHHRRPAGGGRAADSDPTTALARSLGVLPAAASV